MKNKLIGTVLNDLDNAVVYKFENEIQVTIYYKDLNWEWYQDTLDNTDYCSGSYDLNWNGEKVIGYDGVYELPEEVCDALVEYGYKLDL